MTLRYVVFRLVYSALAILGVLVLVFAVTHMLADPVRIALPPNATLEQVEAMREKLGLNEPILVQLLMFLRSAAFDSFGESFWRQQPAMEIVLERVPATIYLALAAAVISLPLGIGMGILASVRPGSLLDRALNIFSVVSVSMVGFWLALMLILLVSVNLRLLPTSGYGGIDHVLLPAITIALLSCGFLAQVTRASVTEEMSKGYISAARARGLSETRVILNHAVRNAAIPIVTISGAFIAGLLGGDVIAETVFGWPGIGLLLVQAIKQRDLPLIEATVFVTAVIIVLANLIVDLLYPKLNPRVRLS
jgi:ABC-type dipeptide/oligopeptide/nickel transport system permease component